MVKLFIVRHCQTVGNSQRLFQGGVDTDPSEIGIFQLGLLSARFKDEKIDVIYSSPLGRAMKTAKAINAFHNLPIKTHDGLKEITVGDMDGMACSVIPIKYPQSAYDWNYNPWDFKSPNGETMKDVFQRTKKAIKEIVLENPNKNVLITSHGCAIRNIMCYLSGLPIEKIDTLPLGTNTAVNIVEIDEHGVNVKVLCDCSHLAPNMYDPNRMQFNFDIER